MATEHSADGRDRTIRAALELLEESGLDALTLRAIGRRLDVRINTVSWHVKSKARLQDLMADAILAEIDLTGLPDAWRERTVELAHRYRAALLAHRDGARVVAGSFAAEPATLAVAETLIAALLEGALDPEPAAWTCWTIIYFTLGLTQEEQAEPGALADRVESAITTRTYPALAKVLPHLAGGEFSTRFDYGLNLILTAATPTHEGARTR
ncbi:TetR/AcrR family transcriptional regulator C-terminal domain-containing protein [Streptomyces sp. NPDC091292]|uniref:TetR/AcrR family transcriptional regulator C-terminal domain-containing protein n=1 Tax=Streptomyces sp. NPDC091292 TaxID=3365991 RepID=UPI00380110BD